MMTWAPILAAGLAGYVLGSSRPIVAPVVPDHVLALLRDELGAPRGVYREPPGGDQVAHLDMVQEAARQSSTAAGVRAAAVHALGGDLRGDVPARLAGWVWASLRYVPDSSEGEVTHGAIRTLIAGCGDCDCLAATWAAMCMSVGEPARVAYVRGPRDQWWVHAMGIDRAGRLHELCKPERTQGKTWPPMQIAAVTVGSA